VSREYQVEGVYVSEETDDEYQVETVYLNETTGGAPAATPWIYAHNCNAQIIGAAV